MGMAMERRRLTLLWRCVCVSQVRGFSAARVVAAEAPAAFSTTEDWDKIYEQVGSEEAGGKLSHSEHRLERRMEHDSPSRRVLIQTRGTRLAGEY